MGALYLCPKYINKHLIANVACCMQINVFCVIDRATYWGHFVPCVSSAEPPAAAPVVPVGGSGENFQTLKDVRRRHTHTPPPPNVMIVGAKTWKETILSPRIIFFKHTYFTHIHFPVFTSTSQPEQKVFSHRKHTKKPFRGERREEHV